MGLISGVFMWRRAGLFQGCFQVFQVLVSELFSGVISGISGVFCRISVEISRVISGVISDHFCRNFRVAAPPVHQPGGQCHGWVGLADMRGAWLAFWSRLAPPTQRRSSGFQDGRAGRCQCWHPGVADDQGLGRR